MPRTSAFMTILLIAGMLLSGVALSACSYGSPASRGHAGDTPEPDHSVPPALQNPAY